jgi:hypothetical protein
MNFHSEIQDSVAYLNSAEANTSLAADPYWPKWHSPWWHMSLLHEMGEAKRIPGPIVYRYIEKLNQMPLNTFCHCQLGNVYQVLAAWGVDVDKEIPWIRPWLLRYQMPDGGLNCDNAAYLVKGEIPSSMVATIAAFEAILLYTPRAWSKEEMDFLYKGAQFLLGRKLMAGSLTKHNSAERVSAEKWTQLCFPRFYFYDVLRGLNAIMLWSKKTNQAIPWSAIEDVMRIIKDKSKNGDIRIERQSFAGVNSLGKQPATIFPLLANVSKVGEVSPFLATQWRSIC